MRIAFCGTPDFAVPSLQMLIDEGHDLALFTNPDKPKGRKGELTPPPTKVLAQKHGIPVYQFEKIRRTESVEALKAFAPELMVTAAFGQILSAENLAIPKYGCINVHGSLLPKYRGAAPVQWSVINGEKITGVTTMFTDVGLDTGDMLLKREVEIGENETAGELFDRLSVVGAELLKETIALLERGELHPVKQDEAAATKCRMISKEDGRLDFSCTAQSIHDKVRGMNPWPVAYAMLDGQPVKIWVTRMTDEKKDGKPGECVITDPKKGLFVQASDRLIEIKELQFPGAKRMEAKAVLLGHRLENRVFE